MVSLFIRRVLIVCFLFEYNYADYAPSLLKEKAFSNDKLFTLSHYKSKCAQGIQSACVYIGVAYKDGDDVPRDLEQAYKLFHNACEEHDALGCAFEGLMYEEGLDRDINIERAIDFYKKACDGGIKISCESLKRLH